MSRQRHTKRLAVWLLAFALFGCREKSTKRTIAPPRRNATTNEAPAQKRLTQAMMAETLYGDTTKALARYKTLASLPKKQKYRRIKALAMFHTARLLFQRGKTKEAQQESARLQRDYPEQRDLHARLPSTKPWPQRKLTLVMRQVGYGKLLKLFANIAKEKIQLKSQRKKKISVTLRGVTWAEALRTVVWSAGDQVQRTAAGFVVQPQRHFRGPNAIAGQAIDTREHEIPARLKWISEIARRVGLTFRLRRSNASIQEQGLGYYSTYGRCRGPRSALIQFLGRLNLLPFPLQIQTFQHRELGRGNIDVRIYLAMVYLKKATPQSRPTTPKDLRLTAAQIQAVIRAHKRGVRRCFQRFRHTMTDKPQHRLIIRMFVTPKGNVTDVSVSQAHKHNSMSRCLRVWASQLRFPSAVKGTRISYPFVFTQ